VAADWHEPMVPQCIMWPSIARANGQLAHGAASKHTSAIGFYLAVLYSVVTTVRLHPQIVSREIFDNRQLDVLPSQLTVRK